MILRILKILFIFSTVLVIAGLSAYFTIHLIIKSEDTVRVPDLYGKDTVYLLEVLTDLGLNAKIKDSEYSDIIEKNHVIRQYPHAGSEIKKGRDVKITLSKGRQTVIMPDLIGIKLRQARIILEENGLCEGVLSQTFSKDIEQGGIIAQVPLPGSFITRSSCVDLLVSLGSEFRAYQMPDLQGLSPDEAVFLIEKYNLIAGEKQSAVFEDKPQNIIVGQEPLPGSRIIEGTRVKLVINTKSGKDILQSKGLFFKYRAENGFLNRQVRIEIHPSFNIHSQSSSKENFSTQYFDGFIDPGEEAWFFIPTIDNDVIMIYEYGQPARVISEQ